VTVVDAVIAVPFVGVRVRVYVVVVAGLTLTGVPLVTARLPGVMIALPLEKTPKRLALVPVVTDVGFAVKLEMVGRLVIDDPVQPVTQTAKAKLARMKLRAMVQDTAAIRGFVFSGATC